MTDGLVTDTSMTYSFLGALHPLLSRLNADRTISPGKIGVLRHLADYGRATTSELAVAVHVSPQGISLAARELERLRLVVRVPDAEDRRRIWIELTDAGRLKLARESSAGHDWLDQAITQRLTPEERKTLEAVIPVLRKLGPESSVE
ncbi:MarR family transcriptional regulator [Paenarthrobacter sp. NPDC089316]|uniref:MarR family winged helix-turn-helix transcriptional regulator n=1 Tax=unclassified Paenarthrobacter TaxID=2634190 RepID=UPI0034355EA3